MNILLVPSDSLDTLKNISDDIQNKYNLRANLIKYEKNTEIEIDDGIQNINEPLRNHRIILNFKSFSDLEVLPNEILIKILLGLPVSSIAKICQTSRRLTRFYKDEVLWRRLVERDFGTIDKEEEEIWKDKYQKITETPVDKLLTRGARIGNIKLVQHALNNNAIRHNVIKLNEAMAAAAGGGHKEIVEMMLNLGATDYNMAMASAARNGYMEIMEIMVSLGANNFILAMANAARGGHKKIVEIMIDLGADNFNYTMAEAARAGDKEIVEMMVGRGADDYNRAMASAARCGYEDIVDIVSNSVANKYYYRSVVSTTDTYKEIVEMMLNRGANNYNQTMINAARSGHAEIVQMMLNRGANNYDQAMVRAARGGHIEIVRMMLNRGINDNHWLSDAIIIAKSDGYNEIVQLIEQYRINN